MKQSSLFDTEAMQSMTDKGVHPERTATKRKYHHSHWSYYQRLKHLITSSPYLTPKIAFEAIKDKNVQIQELHELNRQHAVNKRILSKAVRAMRRYKSKPKAKRLKSKQSISRIARKYHLSRPTLYRGYHRKYEQ